MMTINEAPLNQRLIISSYPSKDVSEISDIESRLLHLGFIEGQAITLKKKAPLFKEPLLVEVRGRLVALTKEEARLVMVEIKV